MSRRIPFRYRIGLLLVLAAIALVTVAAVTLVLGRRSERELTGIETRYVPLIELERDLATTFEKIPHAFEDAAAAAETSGLARADTLHDEFLQRLHAGEHSFAANGGDPQAFAAEFDNYFSRARAVAAELVKGTPAAQLEPQLAELVTTQRAFAAHLERATTPDRRKLADAFASARASQQTSLHIDIIVAISALVLMGLFSWWLIRRTVRALQAVSTGVERLAHGDFGHEILVESGDELGDLAREANRTAIRLREYREEAEEQSWIKTGLAELAAEIAGELDRATLGKQALAFVTRYVAGETSTIYTRDVDGDLQVLHTIGAHVRSAGMIVALTYEARDLGAIEISIAAPDERVREFLSLASTAISIAFHVEESRRRTQTLLAETQRQAAATEAANKELETFSYSVSHDLRAPLRSIDAFSHAILEDYGKTLPPEGQEHLERIRVGAQRMGELIDSLLSLSRVGRGEFRRKPTDLSALAAEVIAELQRVEPERQVLVTIAPGVIVDADPKLLRAVLENLLGNAWKFTSKVAGATIELGVEDANTYFVRDNGAGFDMKYAGALFGPFQRLHTTNDFPGTGIGLATVSRIVARHGGRIWAEAAVGRGATFRFTL